MTTAEFSDTFDTLLNSYNTQANFGEESSRQDIVLDEYEKSVILTQAQDIIVKTYFDRSLNQQGQGFDDSTRRQVDFSNLISVKRGKKIEDDDNEPFDSRGILYRCPSDVLLVLNEKLEIYNNGVLKSTAVIVPINYKEYDRKTSKAYTQPLKKQCWRLFQSDVGIDIVSELIPIEGTIGPKDTIQYKIRYIRRPRPIVLQDFSQDTTDHVNIEGVSTVSECELNPIVHMDILNKAVEIAILTRGRQPQPVQQNSQQ